MDQEGYQVHLIFHKLVERNSFLVILAILKYEQLYKYRVSQNKVYLMNKETKEQMMTKIFMSVDARQHF